VATRVYPSWLPPSPRERDELIKLRRMQIAALGWIVAFIPAGWLLILITGSLDFVLPLTIVWFVAGLSIARRVTARQCPRCGEGFSAKLATPNWYGLFNRRCESCGLSLPADGASRE
jgi:hypothetical protein